MFDCLLEMLAYICTQITTTLNHNIMENLILNASYKFKSLVEKKECIGRYIGKDENSNIVFDMEAQHPFNMDKEGNAVFRLSEYFFFRYFSPLKLQ